MIARANQVWSSDITYLRIERGFAYLVAVIDWHSRRVLAWRLSNTMDTAFCVEALAEAIQHYGTPEIFNTDQGSQFTSEEFTGRLKEAGIRISMDGRGRIFDNIMIERLWRSVKYEEVYVKDYEDCLDARKGLSEHFLFYNHERPHQTLGYIPPVEVYTGRRCMVSNA